MLRSERLLSLFLFLFVFFCTEIHTLSRTTIIRILSRVNSILEFTFQHRIIPKLLLDTILRRLGMTVESGIFDQLRNEHRFVPAKAEMRMTGRKFVSKLK